MPPTQPTYSGLARKWLNGTITDEERRLFEDWYKEASGEELNVPASFAASESELRERLFTGIQKKKNGGQVVTILGKRFAAAAVFLVAAGAAVFFAAQQSRPSAARAKTGVAANAAAVKADIAPGGNKAVLVLANGSVIELAVAANGTIAGNGSAKIIKLNDGRLRFANSAGPTVTGYNTLQTPIGGQYNVTLADGTAVWLNSGSSLRFPTAFAGKEREVELQGEAYFEVARNAAQPFTVKVKDMDVKVLGTHFNVMAYEDEEAVQTTLLEGAVRLQTPSAKALLKPGQQASLRASGAFRINPEADVERAVAWKNGLFDFEGVPIESIMRQLHRWYGIDVEYVAPVSAHFTGTIGKNVGISKVLQMLELTGAVRFAVAGNKVTVQRAGGNLK